MVTARQVVIGYVTTKSKVDDYELVAKTPSHVHIHVKFDNQEEKDAFLYTVRMAARTGGRPIPAESIADDNCGDKSHHTVVVCRLKTLPLRELVETIIRAIQERIDMELKKKG